MKGKSTAAFGLALRALGEVHASTGQGGPVTWHTMRAGWSWIRKHGTEADHAADAREGWEHIKRELAAGTYRFYLLDEATPADRPDPAGRPAGAGPADGDGRGRGGGRRRQPARCPATGFQRAAETRR